MVKWFSLDPAKSLLKSYSVVLEIITEHLLSSRDQRLPSCTSPGKVMGAPAVMIYRPGPKIWGILQWQGMKGACLTHTGDHTKWSKSIYSHGWSLLSNCFNLPSRGTEGYRQSWSWTWTSHFFSLNIYSSPITKWLYKEWKISFISWASFTHLLMAVWKCNAKKDYEANSELSIKACQDRWVMSAMGIRRVRGNPPARLRPSMD